MIGPRQVMPWDAVFGASLGNERKREGETKMRRVLVLALLALVLPIAAWADTISFTNQNGSLNISNAGITSIGSQLLSWQTTTAALGHLLVR